MTAYCEEKEAVLRELDCDPARGLTREEAEARLARYGPNELGRERAPSLFRRLLAQLMDPMVLVLLAAAGLSLWAGGGKDWLEPVIILVIVGVNAGLSVSQEDSARKALDALREMSAPTANLRRDGALCKVEARGVVPGDVVYIQAGDLIPADGRLLSAAGLKVDESAMTGESVPAEKGELGPLPDATPLGDRQNMVLSGTMAVAGKGVMVVTATGMDTEMGRIAGMLGEGEDKTTPLQRRMGEISKILSLLCLAVCGVIFAVGIWRGEELAGMFLTAVSLAVAAIPEGLPAIVTIVLALGVGRLAKRGAIVTRLPAVETLGSAGVICSDKTGTLTRNRMEVTETWALSEEGRVDALTAFALCNDAELKPDGTTTGDPTEGALLRAAQKGGISVELLRRDYPRVGEVPFDSARKRMTTLHQRGTGCRVMVKGGADLLLDRCTAVMTKGGEAPMTPALRREIEKAAAAMGGRALRVLGAAGKALPKPPRRMDEGVEGELTFYGLAGMMDPPRPEAGEAVSACRRAGIRPVMITGDHKATAVAVAKELGILGEGEGALTGEELDFMPQALLEEEAPRTAVFARVTPAHKSRIVRAFQAKGQVVAMTGDGVNDAPALRAADIGCAMGRSGTQVARSASHLILTDDNFATIVSAVAEGRGIYANIRKAIHYLLSCNIGEILTLLTATVLGFSGAPLVPVQLLWLNLVTDSLPALALGVEEVEPGVMDRPPRGGKEKLFDRAFTLRLIWQGCMVGGLTLLAWQLGVGQFGSAAAANTMAFATLTLTQLFHAFNARSETESIFTLGLTSNRAMVRAFVIGLALLLAVTLIPPLRGVFSTVPLTGLQWMTVWALSITPVPVCEVGKMVRGHKK